VLTVALAGTIALVLAACGGESSEPRGFEDAAFEVDRTWSWSEAGADGYVARALLELGRFAPLEEAPLLPGFDSFEPLEDSCLFDEETDALAPVAASMTSGMTREATLRTRIVHGPAWIYGTYNNVTELILATSTPGGVACESLNRNGFSFDREGKPAWTPTWEEVAGGASTGRAYAYVIIRDLQVEDSPKGSLALRLTRSYLGVEAQPGGWITSIDGPGDPPHVFPKAQIEFAGFSLDPLRPPCGIAHGGIRCVR
jgi:hypothetical protein